MKETAMGAEIAAVQAPTGVLLTNYTRTLSRDELALVPCPPSTYTHQTIPHRVIIDALIETLGFRHIGIVRDQYAVSQDGMRMFGVLDLETSAAGIRFSIGLRNANDKSMRLGLVVGYHVMVCDNLAFHGDFQPVLAKHSKNFALVEALSVGVDKMQRNFDPMVKQVQAWQGSQITDEQAKLTIYRAFIEGELEAPKHLGRAVHDGYFHPKYPEFEPRTTWSLQNSFTAAFRQLDPIPHFKATASLGRFLWPLP
jgi:hypothetical protein